MILSCVPHQERGILVSIQISAIDHCPTGNELLFPGVRGHFALTFKASSGGACPAWQCYPHLAFTRQTFHQDPLLSFPLYVIWGIFHSTRDVLKPAIPAKEDEILRDHQAGQGNKKSKQLPTGPALQKQLPSSSSTLRLQWAEQRW